MDLKIQYLKHHQINKQQWDLAIENFHNGLVYALSWYLDVVSPGWNALVLGDYEAVMPLPVKQKLGLKYLIQPPFCQQLGVFCSYDFENKTQCFLNKIQTLFRYIHIQLNVENKHTETYPLRKNYVLTLRGSYKNFYDLYHKNTKRNLKKASNYSLNIVSDIDAKSVFTFKKANPVNNLKEWHYKILHSLVNTIQNKAEYESIGVLNDKGNLIAAAFFVIFKKRITMLVSSSNNQGKNKSAMFLIIDTIIKKYAGKDYILDFEGGNVEGLARFFAGFGAEPVFYSVYKQNNLPWPLNKWF
ncbi:MAG: hypothetical protein PWP52_1441 [Bacteroidales bacterium]|nr:hypothetical protein [Bacteroidales bacterium]